MAPEKLAHMANQIGHFFAHQSEERATAAIAAHIARYWEPRMRREIIAYAQAGGAALDPRPRRAVETLPAA